MWDIPLRYFVYVLVGGPYQPPQPCRYLNLVVLCYYKYMGSPGYCHVTVRLRCGNLELPRPLNVVPFIG